MGRDCGTARAAWRAAAGALVLALAAILLPAAPATAQAPSRVRFVPESPDAHVKVDARYPARPNECEANQPRPLTAAYPGVLEVGRRANGRIYMVAELTFPQYLKGIDEVPRSWPIEALKAQVVAARTYAISHMNPSGALVREIGYNLCATDACQVYRGIKVEKGPWGETWSQAVDSTSGEILEYGGQPASTFYFSTSNGQTYSNAEVFGGAPLPYLKPVTETDDGGSSVSRWSVRMPLTDLAEALRLAGSWGAGPIESVRQEGSSVVVAGGGRSATLSFSDFRNKLNKQSVCLTPKRYPTGRLPQVIPSEWMQVRQDGDAMVAEGRGWGHGVGMVQWGLKGKADRGMAYAEMLAFYYGGLRPVRRTEPGAIRVLLTAEAEEVTIERVGPVRIEGTRAVDGPLTIRGGTGMTITGGQPIQPVLKLEGVSTSGSALPGSPATFSFELSAAAKVALRYRGASEGEVPPVPLDRGPQTVSWDPLGSGLPPGDYEVAVVGDDGISEVVSAPLAVKAARLPAPSPSGVAVAGTPPGRGSNAPPLPVWVAAGAVVLVGAGVLLVRGRRRAT